MLWRRLKSISRARPLLLHRSSTRFREKQWSACSRYKRAQSMREIHDPAALLACALSKTEGHANTAFDPKLHVLVRTPEQLEAAIELRPSSITLTTWTCTV